MIFELIGWIGAILFIISYFLLSKGKLKQSEVRYHLLNLVGAICLVINAIHFRDKANILVNVVWSSIAIMAIYNYRKSFFRNKS